MSKNSKKKFYSSNNAKLMLASVVAASAVTGVLPVGGTDKAEAVTRYVFEKFELIRYLAQQETQWFSTIEAANDFASGLGERYIETSSQQYGYVVKYMGQDTYGPGAFEGEVSASSRYSYPSNGSDGYYWYKFKESYESNRPPATPTLTVPTQQFEHGDKYFIGMNVTDPDGDNLTVTLQASYNNGSWEELYKGPPKTYEYTVPNNKGTSVKFRLIASDGSLSSTSAESAPKSIREVMYYWNKFYAVEINVEEFVSSETYIPWGDFPTGFTNYNIIDNKFTTGGTYEVLSYFNRKLYYADDQSLLEYNFLPADDQNLSDRVMLKTYILKKSGGYKKGSLVQQNIQAGLNAYPHAQRNSDNFWYERGQRVLSEDVTPPIIELTEQSNYGTTSKTTVKTHDLGIINKIKWAKGNQSIAYFGSQGTDITSAKTFTVNTNGVYTVYAEDAKGNKAVQTIDVSKVNTAPVINSVNAVDKFNIVDASNQFKIRVAASDVDGQNLTAKATYGNSQIATSSNSELTLNGSGYSKGFHTTPITVTVNDGIVNSVAKSLNNHIVIRVDNASDYNRALARHTNDANSFTQIQHKAFYDAYEAVLTYEAVRTQAMYETAHITLAKMKEATNVIESETIAEFTERLAVVFANVALSKAEKSLNKTEFEDASNLIESLSLQSNKDLLIPRLQELELYHVSSDLLIPMEKEVARHKTDVTSALDLSILNLTAFNEAKASIAQTKNTTEASYKTELNKRFMAVQSYYLNNKSNLLPEDLLPLYPEADETLSGEYDELKDAFQPISDNGLHLVRFTNALVKFMNNVDKVSYDNYHNTVNTLPTTSTIDFNEIIKITKAVDSIYAFRTTFSENQTSIEGIGSDIQAINIGGPLTKGYLELIRLSMKEVTEYNDVALDEEHDLGEKAEADSQIALLKLDTKFYSNMSEYLQNGLPEIMIDADPYEYIVKDTLAIAGTITDSNHNSHTVTVKFGNDVNTQNTTNGKFSIEFTRPEGVYLTETLTVNVSDSLTNKPISILDKPVIFVSNPELYVEMLKLLETDRGEALNQMSLSTLNELVDILNTLSTVTIDTSPIKLRGLYNQAELLSTQSEGQLEQFIKNHVQANYLEWLYSNYLTATVDDFEFVGIVKNGQPVVTYENINSLKSVITDYKNNHAPAVAPTPSVADYLQWVDMLAGFGELDEKISDIYKLTSLTDVTPAILEVTDGIDKQVPIWTSQRPTYEQKVTDLKDFEKALAAVEKAENSYVQDELDIAVALLPSVVNTNAKQALTERLDELQKVIDAITAVELAESTLLQIDIDLAKAAVDSLLDSPKKQELENRLNAIGQYNDALNAVEQAEQTFTQEDHDSAKTLVDSLLNGQGKTNLLDRLEEVQKVINAISAVEEAERTASDSDILSAQNAIDELKPGNKKEELQNCLDTVKEYSDAVKAVVVAETNLTQADHDNAKVLVDDLPPGQNKTALQDRLSEVQKIIDATGTVENAETTKNPADVADAQDDIDQLQPSSKKDELQGRLDEVNKYIEAEKAVTDAEESLKQQDKNNADKLVDELKDGPDKDALLDRLKDLQDLIDKKSAEDKAEDKVEKAEDTWDPTDLEVAKKDVENLEPGQPKDDLIDRLTELEKIIELYEQTLAAVIKAEHSKETVDANEAQKLLNDLVTLVGTTNQKTDALQDRIDEVNRFISAEKAVTLAENSKYQRHLDEAQILVDKLKPGSDKEFLQDRLDILKAALEGKEDDFLDRIVNGNPPVTSEELADYTDEIVYEELLDEYLDEMREIADETGTLTKEDVIQVVRLINALELAKRSMNPSDITVYQKELALANNAIRSNYPTPQVMFATASYLVDDSKQGELAQGLAALLDRDITVILAEMEALLKGIEEVTSGFYSIRYIDVDTKEVVSSQPIEAEFGLIQFTPVAPSEDYELLESEEVSFELNKETNGKVFDFFIKSIKEETDKTTEDTADVEIKYGGYTTNYILEDGTLVDKMVFENIEFGDITVAAIELDGFELIGNTNEVISLSEENPEQVVTFIVKPISTDDSKEEIVLGSYTVSYMTVENELIKEVEFTGVQLGQHNVEAQIFEDYQLVNGETLIKTIDLTKENSTQNVIFFVEKVSNTTTSDTARISTQYASTIGENSHIVNSLRVASLHDLNLTFTQLAVTPNVSHQQYLYQSAQALLMVKAYLLNSTQQNLDAAMNFVTTNLLDGEYKAQLLELLHSNSSNNGEDGKPDLTPVYPYLPPVEPENPVTPPTEPVEPEKPVTPPTDNGTDHNNNGGGLPSIDVPPNTSVELPTDPIKELPEDGSIAVEEDIHDVIVGNDGSLTWVIENPLNMEFDLVGPNMNISISFDKEITDNAKMLEVMWKYLGNEHYQLMVYADGLEVSRFDAKINLSKERDFAYMQRKVDGDYKALPYNYKNGKFNFGITRTGTFYFSKDTKTFNDIAKFEDTKGAIEELASRLVVNGVSPDKYNPNGKVTRAHFAAMLTRSLGLEASEKETPFKDTVGKWYEKEIQALYEAGIISGTSATTFNPESYLTRQQAALMLNKVLVHGEEKGFLNIASDNVPSGKLPTFADRGIIADNAKVAVAKLESLGLLKGQDGNFNPQNNLTRSQLAKLLVGVLKLTGDM